MSCFKLSDEATAEFIDKHDLTHSVSWLQDAAPQFFEGAHFEVEAFPTDEEESLLFLRIYGTFSVQDFRNRRQCLCRAMLANGHQELYRFIGVFQRRAKPTKC